MATSFGLCRPSSGQNIYKDLNAGVYNVLFVNVSLWPRKLFYYYLCFVFKSLPNQKKNVNKTVPSVTHFVIRNR